VIRNRLHPELSDEELVVAAILGDLEGYDELVRRYRGAVLAAAEQVLRDPAAAQDVAQEALLLAFKALPQLEEPSHFAGWLYSIARHRARRVALRDRRSEPTGPSELDRLILEHSAELAKNPQEEVGRRAERQGIREMLDRLPPEYQMVLRLRYYAEWSVGQIAAFLSLPVTTVKWRLHRGRELMRRHIESEEKPDDGVRSEPGRSPQDPPDAAPHGASGARRQPHGKPGERRPHLRPAVQPDAAIP
jgi:RNA polymerase sigma-70 factor, ECF subfamily